MRAASRTAPLRAFVDKSDLLASPELLQEPPLLGATSSALRCSPVIIRASFATRLSTFMRRTSGWASQGRRSWIKIDSWSKDETVHNTPGW